MRRLGAGPSLPGGCGWGRVSVWGCTGLKLCTEEKRLSAEGQQLEGPWDSSAGKGCKWQRSVRCQRCP